MAYVPKLQSYKRQGVIKAFIKRILLIVLYFFIFTLVIRTLFLQTYRITTSAMSPTLTTNQRVLVSPFLFGKEALFGNGTWLDFTGPKRGTVVMIIPPHGNDKSPLAKFTHVFETVFQGVLPRSWRQGSMSSRSSTPIPRRIIGIPGDVIRLQNGIFYIKPSGSEDFFPETELSTRALSQVNLEEAPSAWSLNSKEVELGSGEYFVGADNRFAMLDSRYWGPVDKSMLRGQVLLRYWPFSALGFL